MFDNFMNSIFSPQQVYDSQCTSRSLGSLLKAKLFYFVLVYRNIYGIKQVIQQWVQALVVCGTGANAKLSIFLL